MDKTWMRFPRNSEVYLLGLGQFLDFAFSQENTDVEGMILCPCKTCKNGICLSREDVEVHLRCVGFINGYTQWIAHGETSNFTTSTSFHNEQNDRDNMVEMLNDAFGVQYDDDDEMDDNEDKETEEPNSEAKLFYKLVDDSKEELWPGCKKFSKLSFLVRLYHIKCLGKMSNKVFTILLDDETLQKAHQYVLFNCEPIKQFIDEHYEAVKKEHLRCSKHEIERIHVGRFASWFVERAELLQDGDPISCDLKLLAKGPNSIGVRYKRILVNGFRFHTKEVESKRKTQNSGVMIKAATSSFSSTKDKNPILGEVAYYGVLKSIIELDYTHDRKVVLFDCDWVSQGNRIKQDEDGFTMVNFSDLKPHNEPFILASQAKQAFYVADPDNKIWQVAILSKARDVYDMDPIDSINMHLQSEVCSVLDTNQMNEELSWGREDVEGFVIEA